VPGTDIETTERGVCMKYDDARLWIVPLTPRPFRLRTFQDRPVSDRRTPDTNRFVTTALKLDLPNGCPALTLVLADTPADAASTVSQEGDAWRIEHAICKVQVRWAEGALILASDQGEKAALRPLI
jgi:hypothetical protein